MKNLIQSAVVALFAASAAHAQQAVQWKVSEGGNGHWYQMRSPGPITWPLAKIDAERLGGHLATPTTDAEKSFVTNLILAVPGFGESATYRWGPWLGGFQDRSAPTFTEPSGAWRWVTGEPWGFAAWRIDEPNNLCSQTQEQEDFLAVSGNGVQSNGAWNDLPPNGCGNDPVVSYIIEWSADCNNDGIVDYGQCRNGTLPDYNGNSIPDCCESGTPCIVGTYPVQWRVADGGNGHWYQFTPYGSHPSSTAASNQAMSVGAHLATLTSASEESFVRSLLGSAACVDCGSSSAFIGARQIKGSGEPLGTWAWVTGESWSYTNWAPGEPNNCCGGEDVAALRCVGGWIDAADVLPSGSVCSFSAIIEWSADCNNDGLVDKGQILRGQLQDANADGVPDICQQPTCRDADFFPDRNINGVDLGVLLSQWGAPTQYTVADLNRDGVVDGIDLGLFLSFWGPCPY